MLASLEGNERAYRQLLGEIAGVVRASTRRGFEKSGCGSADIEDVVQETLLAVHLKRHTWLTDKPLAPWVMTIARNKMIDGFRRRGGRIEVPIELFAETLPAGTPEVSIGRQDMETMLATLKPKYRQVVRSIAVEGQSIRDVASKQGINEGAVRVVLHRGLKAMAAFYRRTSE